MKISPSKPYNNESYAELQIFDAFRNVHMPYAICFNSLHIVSHRDKKMSEIDFVVVCTKGVFIFEVKGGRVFQQNGKWYTRSKQIDYGIDNPFRQSRRAMFSLLDSLILKGLMTTCIPRGYGVLLPNTINLQESVEYDSAMFGVKNCLKGFSSWLESFINYWMGKTDSPQQLNVDDIDKIANYLRPGSLLEREQEFCKLEYLNIKQKQVIDAFELGKRIVCEGAAGTGKTHLMVRLAKKFINQNQTLLVLCESKWLKGYLKSQFSTTNIVVSTLESLVVESRRAFISHYDAVLVDEAQDLYHSHKIDLLDFYLKGGLRLGRWVFFQDLVNQRYFFKKPNNSAINYLKSISDVQLNLDIAYRHSSESLNYLYDLIGSGAINMKISRGPKVEEFTSKNEMDEIAKSEDVIFSAINNGYRYSDITLISNKRFCDSIVSKFPSHLLENINQLDDFNIQILQREGIGFSQLHHFKGLENKVIILLDFDEMCFKNTPKAYLALTRGSERLYIVWAAAEEAKRFKSEFYLERDIVMD